jgi:hypothetical protein
MTASKDKHATSVHPHEGGPERRIVQPTDDGYEVIKPDHKRASAKTDTKGAAQERAKEIVKNLGGGEVTTMNAKGKIENSDTVGHGNDPHPPKDTKH